LIPVPRNERCPGHAPARWVRVLFSEEEIRAWSPFVLWAVAARRMPVRVRVRCPPGDTALSGPTWIGPCRMAGAPRQHRSAPSTGVGLLIAARIGRGPASRDGSYGCSAGYSRSGIPRSIRLGGRCQVVRLGAARDRKMYPWLPPPEFGGAVLDLGGVLATSTSVYESLPDHPDVFGDRDWRLRAT